MIWLSLEDFLAMGGYGRYVWGAVLVSVAALALELALLSRRKHAALHVAAQATPRGEP